MTKTISCDPATWTKPAFPVRKLEPDRLRNGIVVRMPNWLGDAVMALPALRMLKNLLPEKCALAVIAPRNLEPFFMALPWLDVLLPLAEAHRAWSRDERAALRRCSFGAGILFNHSFRDAWMMKQARIPLLFGEPTRFRGWMLSRRFVFAKRRTGVWNGEQFTCRYTAMAEALGAGHWDGRMPEIQVPPLETGDSLVRRASEEGKPLLVLAAGAAYGAAKRWGSVSYGDVARLWLDEGGKVAMVGAASESRIGDEIGSGLHGKEYFNLAGRTSLADLMGVLKRARAAVANDSGVMHLAAALGIPGVAVFGSTDYSATAPVSAKWRILCSEEPCAPCFRRTCPRGRALCMEHVSPEEVHRTLDRLLSGRE